MIHVPDREKGNIKRVVISIITILGQLHRKRIIYKDLNLSKIIWNPETDQLKIINLGIFSSLSREQTSPLSPNTKEGKLHYIYPEQTGKMK